MFTNPTIRVKGTQPDGAIAPRVPPATVADQGAGSVVDAQHQLEIWLVFLDVMLLAKASTSSGIGRADQSAMAGRPMM
jgi:hypothetical protein